MVNSVSDTIQATFIGGGSVFWSALEAIGTIMTVILALFQNQIFQWLKRPIIEISYENGEPWCRNAIDASWDVNSFVYYYRGF